MIIRQNETGPRPKATQSTGTSTSTTLLFLTHFSRYRVAYCKACDQLTMPPSIKLCVIETLLPIGRDDVPEHDDTNNSYGQGAPRSSLAASDASIKEGAILKTLDRNVQFSDTIGIRSILSHKDYSHKERVTSWYSGHELLQMEEDREYILARMEKGKPCKAKNGRRSMTYRGLESWTAEGSGNLQQRALIAVVAVIREQNRQCHFGISSPQGIAAKYMEVSSECRQKALIRAKEDESDARTIQEEDRLVKNEHILGSTEGRIRHRFSWWLPSIKRQK